MSVFEAPEFDAHEQICFLNEPNAGLRAIIAIHNSKPGQAIGGCRMWPYADEREAIRDVLRLSRAMTYKAAVLGLELGGAKSVIIGNPSSDKTPELFRAFGRHVDALKGRYIVAEDVGTNPLDMRMIRDATRYVVCLREQDGGDGDPAPLTARGTLNAIRAGIEHRTGSQSVVGLRVAVQGIGNAGWHLCRLLHEAGAQLLVSDIHQPSAERAVDAFGAKRVDPDEIYSVDADVFAPCALGAVLNNKTIPQLKARVVAGAANNQLDEAHDAQRLKDRGIVFVPDCVASSGGLIGAAAEWFRSDRGQVHERVNEIYDTSMRVLKLAKEQGITPDAAVAQIAAARLARPMAASGRTGASELKHRE